ncbi:Peroxin-3 [Kockovaella imperatae]|uniref:Peroxin-3 n=1 Tax=Kockovaella imperatae TaxID=4999 RepID=A0A1Y1U9H8_9TREE|nr:Peroxin-3 [Kockovaella imperatae]ORX34166.1 Peroxin-3 [Kockovaella imperatae]
MPSSSSDGAPWQRRFRRMLLFVGTATSFYLVSSYILDRLREARARAIKEKKEKDLLRNHFTSLQNTIHFTLYALLPTLQPQLSAAYPVEVISQAIQGKSTETSLSGSIAQTPESSMILQGAQQSPQNHTESTAQSITNGQSSPEQGVTHDGRIGESWASEFKQRENQLESDAGPDETQAGAPVDGSMLYHPSGDEASSTMSQSISLPPTDISSASASPPSDLSHSAMLHSSPPRPLIDIVSADISGKSKKELWKDLKLQTLTRSLTTAYLLPLLHLLTASQLATLARLRYMEDVKRQNRPEHEEEPKQIHSKETSGGWFSSLPIPSLGIRGFVQSKTPAIISNPRSYIPAPIEQWIPSIPFMSSSSPPESTAEAAARCTILESRQAAIEAQRMEDERIYLSYSWWILHEGWRHLARRVDSAVEDVFGGIALKKELTVGGWQQLIKELRARVETVTVDGAAALYSFTDNLLPPDPIRSTSSTEPCPLPSSTANLGQHLQYLLGQTKTHLSSPDANYLIHKGVTTMTAKLLQTLSEELYSGQGDDSGKRLVDCLPVINRWSKSVWEGLPDNGVEALLAVPEYEGFVALVFGDWAPTSQ